MVQIEDHMMRSECAKEFGAIKTALDFHKEWRIEQTHKLDLIQKEVEKLTGNGNRGKIDELFSKLGSLESLIATHIAIAESSQHRIEQLEAKTTRLEERIYSTALKVAGVIGVVTLLLHWLGSKFL